MYGFFNSALEKLVRRRFGDDKWDEICEQSGVLLGDTHSFQAHRVYKDSDLDALLQAATEVFGLDNSTLLEMLGEQFLLWCHEYGHSKILKVLGRSLLDFLTNIDSLHDSLTSLYPQMKPPSFRCSPGAQKSDFYLHYYSVRVGLDPFVVGIVKAASRKYYQTEVTVTPLAKKGQDGSDHSVFLIQGVAGYNDTSHMHALSSTLAQLYPDQQLLSTEVFCKTFPFHVIFDRDLSILQCGGTMALLLSNFTPGQQNLTSYFTLEQPTMKLSFDMIMSHINTLFVLRMNGRSVMPPKESRSSYPSFLKSGELLSFRGQMVHLPESDTILFLCSPRVKKFQDLESSGLYLSDIPLHDATRGLFVMGQVAESEFVNSVRLEELVIQLQSVQKSLEEEKQRMAGLLREMLPISVADNLMAGRMVEAERFESVTILFSDIVGFTTICSKSEPMQIVNMLNKLYSCFDQCVGQNQVYKVETIGDAYMVVGGLPERNMIHAECVANQALDMMYYSRRVSRPDNNNPIIMRIGVHSGEVVAGIVGLRMPRYCLFGNTVNVASRTESSGIPGRIQITEHTYNLLKHNSHFSFTYRGTMEFKNVPNPVPCYFLLENSAKSKPTPVTVPFSEDLVPGYDLLPRLMPSMTSDSISLPATTAPKTKYSSLLTVPPTQLEQESANRSLSSSSASSSSSSSTLLSRDGEGSVTVHTLVVPDISVTSWSSNTTPTSSRKGSSADLEIASIIKKLSKQPPFNGFSSDDSDSETGNETENGFSVVPQCPFSGLDPPDLAGSFYLGQPHHPHTDSWGAGISTDEQLGVAPNSTAPPQEEAAEDSMYGSIEGSDISDLEAEERRGGGGGSGGRERGRERGRKKGESRRPVLLNVTGGCGGEGCRVMSGRDLGDIRGWEGVDYCNKTSQMRKISDCSSRSADSGTKMSEISKDEDEMMRKLSVASNVSDISEVAVPYDEEEGGGGEGRRGEREGRGGEIEDEERKMIRVPLNRRSSGLVHSKVEFFNGLSLSYCSLPETPVDKNPKFCRAQSEGGCLEDEEPPQKQGSLLHLQVSQALKRRLHRIVI